MAATLIAAADEAVKEWASTVHARARSYVGETENAAKDLAQTLRGTADVIDGTGANMPDISTSLKAMEDALARERSGIKAAMDEVKFPSSVLIVAARACRDAASAAARDLDDVVASVGLHRARCGKEAVFLAQGAPNSEKVNTLEAELHSMQVGGSGFAIVTRRTTSIAASRNFRLSSDAQSVEKRRTQMLRRRLSENLRRKSRHRAQHWKICWLIW